jgi:hypothetical protein
MSEALVTELMNRPELSAWVTISSILPSSGAAPSVFESLCAHHRDLLASLRDFHDKTLVPAIVHSASPAADLSMMSAFGRRVYHQVRWIDREIAELNEQHRKEMKELFDSIIQYLTIAAPSQKGISATVNRESLFRFAASHPQTAILRRYAEFRATLAGEFRPILATDEDVRQELIQVIEFSAQAIDPRTSFYPHNRVQHTFEGLIMSEKLKFAAELNSVIARFPTENSHAFLDLLFRFVVDCLKDLRINRKPNDAALVLLLIRFVFGRVYDVNPFFKESGRDVIGSLSSVVMGQLSPPQDFLPPFDEKMRVVDFFRADPFFSQSITALEVVVFQTNGFDVLDCVEKSLTHIERAAFHYNNGETIVFPFEVTFAFFLGVLISSHIPNWEQIAHFVEAYTPPAGLCPAFEFSRAKVIASLIQFREMRHHE